MADEPAESLTDLVGDLEMCSPPLAPRRIASAEYVRDLTEADVGALALNRGTKPKSLVRIHASHHALARCLASGMKRNQAALITGYSPDRISALQADESFIALVADYRIENKSIVADLAERMANLSLDAIELLQERLHESPTEFSVPVLLDVVRAFADRTGHGPGSEINHRVNGDFVDRPPRETQAEWEARRLREIAPAPKALEYSEVEAAPEGPYPTRTVN